MISHATITLVLTEAADRPDVFGVIANQILIRKPDYDGDFPVASLTLAMEARAVWGIPETQEGVALWEDEILWQEAEAFARKEGAVWQILANNGVTWSSYGEGGGFD